jgi:hypothetical protein
MALPNAPSATEEVLANQEWFRIFQQVESPGSIFEIDSSSRAIYIGPNSDLAEVRVAYYNRQANGVSKQDIADVSVNGPLVGRMDSLLATQYPSLNQQARLLAYPVDIVDPDYVRPTNALFTPLRRYNVPARIDLICALKDLPQIPNVRADRTLRYPRVPFQNDGGMDDDGSTDLVIPIYGRRMVTIQIITPVMTAHETSFYLAALQPGQSTFPKFLGSVIKTAISVNDTDSIVFRASDQINRDEVEFSGTTADPAMPTWDGRVLLSPPLPKSKGLADLLIINIKPDYGLLPPPGYSTVDLFIKLSDRED